MNTVCLGIIVALACAWACASRGADAPAPQRPRDAAEAVQEGNVQNWVEYYRRTRPQVPPPATPPEPPRKPPPAPH